MEGGEVGDTCGLLVEEVAIDWKWSWPMVEC